MNSFEQFGFSESILTSLGAADFSEPTEVQSLSMGAIMNGHDVIAVAQTGSGKTAAYALPSIHKLTLSSRKAFPRVLVLVPTRELAIQVGDEFRRFGPTLRIATVYGGTGYFAQIKALKRGVDVIVATPGRLQDLLKQKVTNLQNVEMLVLDEADRLMDMGFLPQVRALVQQTASERQTLLFSATVDTRIEKLAGAYMREPMVIRSSQPLEPVAIEQNFHYLSDEAKDQFLLNLMVSEDTSSVIVFTKTRRRATSLAKRLRDSEVEAEEIHSDVSQNKRERILLKYRKQQFKVLVATDIAARGLDVPHITHVVNYDLPTSAQDYVHRIGRTGRAGRAGVAHTLVSDGERHLLRDIEKVVGRQLAPRPSARNQDSRDSRRGRHSVFGKRRTQSRRSTVHYA